MTRRDLLKSSIAVSASTALSSEVASAARGGEDASQGVSPREKLLLDSGWRFSLGHADDPARDFGFAGGDGETFSKSSSFFMPGEAKFDDSAWKKVDLPHDWAVELPFENDKNLVRARVETAGAQVPGDQHRLVPARVRHPGGRCGAAHRDRV